MSGREDRQPRRFLKGSERRPDLDDEANAIEARWRRAPPPVTCARVARRHDRRDIQLISSAIGTLPFSLFRHTDAGGKEPVTDHPAFDLVADSPNDWTASSDLRAQLAQDAMLHGDAYAYANKIDGRVVEIIRPVPGSVTMLINYATGEPSYRINPVAGQGNLDGSAEAVGDAGESRVLPYDEVIHIRSPLSLNGDTGIAPIQHGREAIALALTLEQHAARLFGNTRRRARYWSYRHLQRRAGSISKGCSRSRGDAREAGRRSHGLHAPALLRVMACHEGLADPQGRGFPGDKRANDYRALRPPCVRLPGRGGAGDRPKVRFRCANRCGAK